MGIKARIKATVDMSSALVMTLWAAVLFNRYRRDAESVAELNLGWFTPLHEAIPELAALGTHPAGTSEIEAPEVDSTANMADNSTEHASHSETPRHNLH